MTDNITDMQQTSNVRHSKCEGGHDGVFRMRWSWFPSLFFGDGMLLSALTLSAMMLRRFGLNNAQVALCMSLLCIPFVLRPLLEVIVAHFRGTTKVWILTSQFVSALSMWAMAFTIPMGYWFQGTMCFMPFVVVSGGFYSIAASRFYVDRPSMGHDGGNQNLWSMLFRGMSVLFGVGAVMMLAGNMEVLTRSVRYSWSVVFYVMAGVEFFLWLWHSLFLPGGTIRSSVRRDFPRLCRGQCMQAINGVMRGFANRFTLCFFFLYVLPEGLLVVVGQLFFVDAPHNGGLGLSPQEFGLVKGTVGVVAFFLGQRFGVRAIRRYGVLRCLLPMTLAVTAHGLAMLYLSYNIAASLALVCMAVFVGDIFLGVGITAYLGVVRMFASGLGFTLGCSVGIAVMSLGLVGVGTFSGLLQVNIGYRQYFMSVVALYAVSLLVALFYMVVQRRSGNVYDNGK